MVLLLLHGIMWDTTISMAKLVCGLREDAEKVKQNLNQHDYWLCVLASS